MTKHDLKTKHADLYAAIKAEGVTEGAAAERERILTIQASAMPGYESIVADCIKEGVSAGDAATRILAAEKSILDNLAVDFNAAGSDQADTAEPVRDEHAELNSIIDAGVAAANEKRKLRR